MNTPTLIQALLARRSVLANNLCEPGPNEEECASILAAGHRVPDHGKLGPWRFILFQQNARKDFGQVLLQRFAHLNPEASNKLLAFEADRFMRAPLVVAVISSPKEHKVPQWEQVLSAGAVCQNILLACGALNYSAQWLTEWYAYDEGVAKALNMAPSEKIAGFIYVGSASETPSERVRPDLQERIQSWQAEK